MKQLDSIKIAICKAKKKKNVMMMRVNAVMFARIC
jgi:hypothetical protein